MAQKERKHRRAQVIMTIVAVSAIVIAAALWLMNYFAVLDQGITEPETPVIVASDLSAENDVQEDTTQGQEVAYRTEIIAEGLFVPWSIVVADENRILVSERSGTIRVIENGILRHEPLYTFDSVSSQSEEGLMGMVKDPHYSENHFLYACYASAENGKLHDRVVRLKDEGSQLIEETIILDQIPAARNHAGCRLQFGPDDKLYITTGDATDRQIAQDRDSLGGKILRLNPDGSIPEDNPQSGSPIYSLGHRNPQGITWHPESGVMIATEHGPSLFDGPAGGDEVNHIIPGGNYGWPLFSHDRNGEGYIAPLVQFTPAVAPGSALIYSGDLFPQWKGRLLFGALKGEGIYSVTFTDSSAAAVASYEKLDIDVGRVREVVQGPNGMIYFTTSNRDGRGNVRAGDDKVYRIVPQNTGM